MPDASHLALFVAAALALLAIPGPAVLFTVAQSVSHGRRAGLVSVLGVHAGSLVHVTAAVVGLSSLLVSSAEAYTAVKYAGAVYLVWLGVRRLLGRDRSGPAGAGREKARGRLIREGFVVNVLNPKTALFFFAFLPQFVEPAAGKPRVCARGAVRVGSGAGRAGRRDRRGGLAQGLAPFPSLHQAAEPRSRNPEPRSRCGRGQVGRNPLAPRNPT